MAKFYAFDGKLNWEMENARIEEVLCGNVRSCHVHLGPKMQHKFRLTKLKQRKIPIKDSCIFTFNTFFV